MAAGDAVGLGHDIIRLGGGEEVRHAGQVRGSGHAPDRHRRADDALLLAERTVFELCEMRVHAVPMLAVDNARRDGVDLDAIAAEVQPSGVGPADLRRRGRAIEADQRFTAAAALPRHATDLAALPTHATNTENSL